MDERMVRAAELCERAIFNGEFEGLTAAQRELDAVQADLAVARGKVLHARFLDNRVEDPHELPLFEQATELYGALGDQRGEANAQFWIGCFHQVVRDDVPASIEPLTTSRDLAHKAGDDLTLSYAVRHLGIAAQISGDLDGARTLLEESTALRRTLGFTAGVAANLVGLIYVAIAQDRPDDARALADEAQELAASAGAVKVSEHIEAARSRI
ncbi:tetratricopeptide repeat protein [Kribbella pittospori]|uniref:Tetratricopeptide repeat protein n=1 Tax=Kribbella pittospori TaxID=722689 RepID=A0A4R0KNU7_9ACTN|nr:tetratricopeptide repeat protein [Kribbella pittospori]TCC61004.1 tetratricopeptide repeat protein [Kribbella pittospori]